MRSGTLNKKISIRKMSPSTGSDRDSFGAQSFTWTTYLNDRWASVRPLSMNELFRADQVQAQIDTEVIMRYATGISPDMLVIYGSKEYNIHSIIDTGDQHREMRLLCSRRST
jgi:SPP1 family predicted phage head-tail adaptor